MIEAYPDNRYGKVSEFRRKLDSKNTRKSLQSANGRVVLANSSLPTSARPGMEISLAMLRNLLAKGLEDHQ